MITAPTRVSLLNKLADLILQVDHPHPIRVAIDGIDAAGKSILCDELVPIIKRRGRPVIRASIDSFHRPRAERYRRGDNSPEGYYLDSFDYPTVVEHLLLPLGPSGNRQYKQAAFDSRTDSPVIEPLKLAPIDAVLLMDGVFLLRSELIKHWDFRIFVDVDFEVAISRAIIRDVDLIGSPESVYKRYRKRYIPGQSLYLQSAQPQMHADVVINNNNPEEPELMVVAFDKGIHPDEDSKYYR